MDSTKRLFIAIDIVPNEQFLTIYNKLKSQTTKLDKINWVSPDLMHITLKFLGETAEEKIPAIVENLGIACKDAFPFNIDIGKLGLFGSRYQPRVLWVGADNTDNLQNLHISIEKQMRKLGFPRHIGNFVPHLTLARINKIDDKKRFIQHIEKNQIAQIQQLTVKEIILYESILNSRIPVYEKIAVI
jgi:2'-5' RNA ligase